MSNYYTSCTDIILTLLTVVGLKVAPVLRLILRSCSFYLFILKPTILDGKRQTGLTNPEMAGWRTDRRRDRWNGGKGSVLQRLQCPSFISLCIHPARLTAVYRPQGKGPYYPFPHLRVKLQRDPKDRSVSGEVPQLSACHSMKQPQAKGRNCIDSVRHVLLVNGLLTVMHTFYWPHCLLAASNMYHLQY